MLREGGQLTPEQAEERLVKSAWHTDREHPRHHTPWIASTPHVSSRRQYRASTSTSSCRLRPLLAINTPLDLQECCDKI